MSKLDALEHFQLAMTELRHLMDELDKPYSIRDKTINHPAYNETVRRIATLHRRGRELRQGGGLLVTGHSGIGKSKVLCFYRDEFPKYDDSEGAVIPVLYVVTPAAPTVKNLAESILTAMGDPFSHKGTSEQKTSRIYLLLKKCRVELLMIDEFQHFADTNRRSESRAVTDWLKNLLSVAKIPVVLAGLPHSESVIRANPQLARRFSSRKYIRPFEYESIPSQQIFRGILKAIQKEFPISGIPLHDANVARRIFVATNGVIDYLCKLLDRAIHLAMTRPHRHITLEVLCQSYVDEIWLDCPPNLNPFTEDSLLRPLTGLGEPFESHREQRKFVALGLRVCEA
jgi:hypothetical protein